MKLLKNLGTDKNDPSYRGYWGLFKCVCGKKVKKKLQCGKKQKHCSIYCKARRYKKKPINPNIYNRGDMDFCPPNYPKPND